MTRVLLCIDEDESRAKSQAETTLDLLETEDLSVDVLHVFEENPEGATATQLGSVRRAREILEDAGVEVTIQGEGGNPAQMIVDHADRIDADAVCLSGRKRSPAGKVVFGSVTQDVILDTERSVLVCSPDDAL